MNNEIEMVHKRINITLPEEVLKLLKEIAKKEDRPVSNIIKRAILHYKEKIK